MQSAGEGKPRSKEDSINFRPSPNFKHMKKYLKSKFEEDMALEKAKISQGSSDQSPSGPNEQEKVNAAAVTQPVVFQPPLPPNPPPPDTPPPIKKEIEDDGYNTTSEYQADFKPADIKTDFTAKSEKPEPAMCRNFVRGTCKKGAACIFVHELILSQLPGVYTFCRNFQNSVCTFPKCKFVHATVFEKEHFYRTGYLPPHTRAHLQDTLQQPPPLPQQNTVPQPQATVLQPQPTVLQPQPTVLQSQASMLQPQATVLQPQTTMLLPPPPPPPPEEEPMEMAQYYSEQPGPSGLQEYVQPAPMLPYAGVPMETYDAGAADMNVYGAMISPTTASRYGWTETGEYTYTPYEYQAYEPQKNDCEMCPTNEFREEYNKAKLDQMRADVAEQHRKLEDLTKRDNKLNLLLRVLMTRQKTSSAMPNLMSVPPSFSGDTENLMGNVNLVDVLSQMLVMNIEGGRPLGPS